MNGKEKCKLMKQIRRDIADANGIEYRTDECKHKGNCSGTCQKCEAELDYLRTQIEKRRKLGKSIAVVGISAALISGMSSCSVTDIFGGSELSGDVPYRETDCGSGEDRTANSCDESAGTETYIVGEIPANESFSDNTDTPGTDIDTAEFLEGDIIAIDGTDTPD